MGEGHNITFFSFNTHEETRPPGIVDTETVVEDTFVMNTKINNEQENDDANQEENEIEHVHETLEIC